MVQGQVGVVTKMCTSLQTLLSILESQKLSAVADEAYLAADTPLSVRPGESQTLSAVAAGCSVANNELCLFPSFY